MERKGAFTEEKNEYQSLVRISKAHRLCYYLLTSKELGFKQVLMEVPILNG
jgi:hypothetical protein